MSLKERQQQIVAEFSGIESWEDRYKKMIQMGKALPDLPDSLKTEESKVKGCQSQVWLHAKLNDQGLIEFQADSDALLVKGLVALLLKVFNKSTPKEVLDADIEFIKEIGLGEHLTPSRANGLMSMIKQIKYFATAFAYLAAQKK